MLCVWRLTSEVFTFGARRVLEIIIEKGLTAVVVCTETLYNDI